MKVAILAGGKGTRIDPSETGLPKPLVPIGGHSLLWHVMQIYRGFGHGDFVIALGHLGEEIVRHFLSAPEFATAALTSPDGGTRDPRPGSGSWHIRLVDTGPDTLSAGRIRRLRPFLAEETFMLTWCDGLADIDIAALAAFHAGHGKTATVTAVHPPPRFGRLEIDGERVTRFEEKGVLTGEWINGAFFVLEPDVFDAVPLPDDLAFETAPLQRLSATGELMAYRHDSFWRCVDMERERRELDRLWEAGTAPWKTWGEGEECA
ncbi:MAG: sugar phosphate nucleotidyltransferase [Alphaproteobacteria bacterium]|nr:sugar phosphate nucleotidyltransferase [Alphaproteobacteria bacterium]